MLFEALYPPEEYHRVSLVEKNRIESVYPGIATMLPAYAQKPTSKPMAIMARQTSATGSSSFKRSSGPSRTYESGRKRNSSPNIGVKKSVSPRREKKDRIASSTPCLPELEGEEKTIGRLINEACVKAESKRSASPNAPRKVKANALSFATFPTTIAIRQSRPVPQAPGFPDAAIEKQNGCKSATDRLPLFSSSSQRSVPMPARQWYEPLSPFSSRTPTSHCAVPSPFPTRHNDWYKYMLSLDPTLAQEPTPAPKLKKPALPRNQRCVSSWMDEPTIR